mmetsp:Transcript_9759/g.24304  ORF Transcript_9759/g.24304 Transcript_9759/m.24304 type:complete len:309 (-) Transcript_9759:849-1775(-)
MSEMASSSTLPTVSFCAFLTASAGRHRMRRMRASSVPSVSLSVFFSISSVLSLVLYSPLCSSSAASGEKRTRSHNEPSTSAGDAAASRRPDVTSSRSRRLYRRAATSSVSPCAVAALRPSMACRSRASASRSAPYSPPASMRHSTYALYRSLRSRRRGSCASAPPAIVTGPRPGIKSSSFAYFASLREYSSTSLTSATAAAASLALVFARTYEMAFSRRTSACLRAASLTTSTALSSISLTACCWSRSVRRKCLSACSWPPCCSMKVRKMVRALSRRATNTCASVMLKWRRQGSRNAAFWSPNTSWLT